MSSRFHVLGRLTILVGLGLWALGCERGAELEGGPPPAIAPENGGDPALPGVVRVDAELQEHLDRELRAKSTGYAPRTHNLDKSGAPRFTNRLILESSPYLLQHAHNPVNWYPWSEEAFRRAKRENKPVFLSVGYSTCHWCHVMERESFEDPEIAAFLNRHFIAIKVDREERPDVDSVYMTAVQLLTGRGGWPMTVVMTPDKDPFFGGTYFPPRRGVRGARLGLVDILAQMAQLYTQDPTRALQQAQQLSQRVAEVTTTPGGQGVPSDRTIVAAVQRFAATFDPIHGGFGGAPKFPQPARLALLLRYARRTADPAALEIVTTTLDRMAAGGVYDHVGGGFHRYSTDREWLVPHFEKMLYDNAQLASVYVDAWQLTGNDDYRRVARDILDYVAREMTSSAGAFYSATDADSPTPSGHEEEGWFFTWSAEELQQLLGDGDAEIVGTVYGVTPDGNFEGRSILHRVMSDARAATELEISPERVDAGMRKARPLLYDARTSRPPPLRDEKVIAAWNGLMISAFAKAGWALDDPSYTSRAASAAQFVLDEMRDGQRLARTFKDGRRSEAAFLDDYAFLVAGCLDLYEATGDPFWLRQAISLQTRQDVDYVDREHGAYFMSARDGEVLLVREKPTYDGAIPSGNSVAALNLLRLHDFTGEVKWRLRAEKLFSALSARLQQAPSAHPALLVALDYYYDIALEVMLVAQERDATRPLAARLRTTFAPNKVFAVLDDAQALAQAAVVPWLEGKRPIGGKPTAYVCERGRCELPTSSPGVFQAQIDRRRPYPSYAKARPPKLEIGRGVTH